MSGRIQDRGETFSVASVEGRKLNGAEITLYTVLFTTLRKIEAASILKSAKGALPAILYGYQFFVYSTFKILTVPVTVNACVCVEQIKV